jgi:hypothetical protein
MQSLKYIASCETCQELWRAYSEKTTAHIKIQGQLHVASVRRESEFAIELTQRLDAAAELRAAARQAIQDHERSAHPDPEQTAGGASG